MRDDPSRDGRSAGLVRDRHVVLLMAGVVVGVLAVNLLSAAIPGLDEILARAPVLVLLLVGVTALVLVRALTRPRR